MYSNDLELRGNDENKNIGVPFRSLLSMGGLLCDTVGRLSAQQGKRSK